MNSLTRFLYFLRNFPQKNWPLETGRCYLLEAFNSANDFSVQERISRLGDLGLRPGIHLKLVRQSFLGSYATVFDIENAGRIALSNSELTCLKLRKLSDANL